jgi:hypothetical protein
MPLCHWCKIRPAFKNCHVVSDFIIRWLKKQSVENRIHYTWAETFSDKQIVGPYFCRRCDNHVFGTWENEFSKTVFPDPMAAAASWPLESSVRFAVTICYRYAMHHLRVSPHNINSQLNTAFRDTARATLQNLGLLGNQLFIYPYIYRPITASCRLRPRVNHLLTMGFHARAYLAEDNLPHVLLVYLPKMMLLFALGDLTQTGDADFAAYAELRPGFAFNPQTANVNMPDVFARYTNHAIVEMQQHFLGWGLWKKVNRWAVPTGMIQAVTTSDSQLRDWQEQNCHGQVFP